MMFMKTLLPILILSVLTAHADWRSDWQNLHAARLQVAARDPYRMVGDKVYDLSARFRWNDQVIKHGFHLTPERPLPEWDFVFGKVQQMTANGLLLRMYGQYDYQMSGDDELVFVKNVPENTTVVDGDPFALYAMPDGRYQYVTTLGATKTVRAYDYGTKPSDRVIAELQVVDRVKQASEKEQLDRQAQEAKRQSQQAAEASNRKARDFEEANFKLRLERAAKGEGESQMRVADYYLDGIGTERDELAARRWLQAAVTNGIPRAAKLLGTLNVSTNQTAGQ